MSDPKLVGEILASAQDALARGFAILTCEPHDKSPWALYSPHAVNSSTRNPDIALKAWKDGHEANYGVGCGPSGLTVVDVDEGVHSVEELLAWMNTHNLPMTLTVISGREGFGAHLYYTKSVKTTPYNIGGVKGELRGNGAYVVGAGSVHPDTGKKYTVYKDMSPVPLPDGFIAIAVEAEKNPLDINKTKAENNGIVPASSRNAHWTSLTGKLLNMGLDEEDIYDNLIRIARKNFEDGENYAVENDAKARDLAARACANWDATSVGPTVVMNDCKKKRKETEDIQEWKLKDEGGKETACPDALEGDWIAELAHLVTDNTWIPLAFARAVSQTILSESLDGLVGYPGYKDLHLRNYNILLSTSPESGKGQSWERVGKSALSLYITKTGMQLPANGMFSSGEHLVKYLSDATYNGKHNLVWFDEGRDLFLKGSAPGSKLLSVCTQLFESAEASAGSLTHSGGHLLNTSMSMLLPFPLNVWNNTLAGAGTIGDGLLSRCIITYGSRGPKVGLFGDVETTKVNEVAARMFTRWQHITKLVSENKGEAISAIETPEATKLREAFEPWLKAEGARLREENSNVDYLSRLFAHFLRDVLIRAIFSGNPEEDIIIDEQMMARGIFWAKHQLYLRTELWPVDLGSIVERMEQNIRKSLKRNKKATKANLQTDCNVYKAGSGGMETFLRAFKALMQGGALTVVGHTHKRTEVYALTEDIE